MNYSPLILATALAFLAGCSNTTPSCEDIEDIMAQRHECEEMAKRIKQTTSVVVRSNLQEIYEKQCVDIRFYRDSFDDKQVCSAKKQQQEVEVAEKGK